MLVVCCFSELLPLSRSQRSSFPPLDSYQGCSSPTCSLLSMDSLDQFCKDFQSSFNFSSETCLSGATLQLCGNKEWSDLDNSEINKEQGFANHDSLVLSTSPDKADQGSLNVDTSPNYEGKFRQLHCLNMERSDIMRVHVKFAACHSQIKLGSQFSHLIGLFTQV